MTKKQLHKTPHKKSYRRGFSISSEKLRFRCFRHMKAFRDIEGKVPMRRFFSRIYKYW